VLLNTGKEDGAFGFKLEGVESVDNDGCEGGLIAASIAEGFGWEVEWLEGDIIGDAPLGAKKEGVSRTWLVDCGNLG
jgi:hypothetical protein